MRFLLDTNIVSEVMRITPDQNVLRNWEANRPELVVAAPTWHELLFGIARMPPSERRQLKESFLMELSSLLPILPYDQAAADWHAFERARLVAIGKTPAYVDGQIAAVGAVNQLTIVTTNTSDFAHFTGLAIEDWTKRK